ncbi:MAG: hypothetical protein Q4A50_07920, partial [Bacteroidales bacterium]|nr:hypothetical protein [Bacteroidales bacterium]
MQKKHEQDCHNCLLKTISFVLAYSPCGYAEGTSARQKKEKRDFSFFCARLFALWLRRRYFRS